MRDKLRRRFDNLRHNQGGKIITAIDAALVIAAILIVSAIALIGATR